jgi:hypothetical protein
VVLVVLAGDTLVSLPDVSVQLTQSVIPIGACLFILCEALSLPDHWRALRDHDPVRGGADGDDGATGEPQS